MQGLDLLAQLERLVSVVLVWLRYHCLRHHRNHYDPVSVLAVHYHRLQFVESGIEVGFELVSADTNVFHSVVEIGPFTTISGNAGKD